MSKINLVPVVYLAGGMRSNWQDKVMEACPGVLFIDPRQHGSKVEAVYTAADLTGVARCDVVFGFLEKDNPGGSNLSLEFGAACALGKHIVFVEEPDRADSKYYGMTRAVSDSVHQSLAEGIEQLQRVTGLMRKTGHVDKDAIPRLQAAGQS